MSLRLVLTLNNASKVAARALSGGNPGSGSGRGGGSGGSIRDAGGAFGKMEAAREDEYFHKLQKKQLAAMKNELAQELEHHKAQMKNHEEAVKRHQSRLAELEKHEQKISK